VGLIVEKNPQLSVLEPEGLGMGDHLGSPSYRVQAAEVMIDAMRFNTHQYGS